MSAENWHEERNRLVRLLKAIETGKISATVEDDGKGFDTNLLEQTQGIGWSNIRSRVDYLKGKVDLRSKIGEGTSVHIEIPL